MSFCNVRDKSKPIVAAIDLRGDRPSIEWIEVKKGVFLRGATGLCFWESLICVVYQQGGPTTSPGFVFLDPARDFEQVGEGVLPSRSDPHSVCSRDGKLYFVLSRKDSVFEAALDHRTGEWTVSPYWIFPNSSGEADENHLNAIDCVDGDLCVSGFGRKEGEHWLSATRGFVYNIDRAEYVVRDVYHPHSLLIDSNTVWTSESARNRLVSGTGREIAFPAGYIRGLAMDDNSFYAGSSKRRKVSESTGVVNPQAPEQFEGTCCVYKLAGESSDPQTLADFSEVRNEIYEMLLL